MARIVLLVDPNTGALVDIAGRNREGGKFLKFIRRMLSLDKNPILDYGVNGGDTLEISKNGVAGKAVNIKADVLNVSGEVKSGNKTIADIVNERISDVASILRGKDGEIEITEKQDEDSGQTYYEISLDSAVSTLIEQLNEALEAMQEVPKKYISKQSLSEALEGIEIHEEDTLEDVKAQFSALVRNLNAIASETDTETEEAEGEPDE